MLNQVNAWKGYELPDASAKLIIYRAFIEGGLEVPKHLADDVHRHYFDPQYDEFRPRTMWSFSNAFTSAFKELDPIPRIRATAQTITWIKYDPSAIRSDRTAPATLELLVNGTVTGVRLDYGGGGSLNLAPTGPGRWGASVPAAQLLAGYDASDVNHNFVGVVRLLGAGRAAPS